jgi:hypothetical protein
MTVLRDSRIRFERRSPPLRAALIVAVSMCGMLMAGLCGPAWQGQALAEDGPNAAAEKQAQKGPAGNRIVEGLGWKDVRVGVGKDELLKILGQPDADSTSDWLKWKKKHIECSFYPGATGVCEVRFDPGFNGALANGLKLGSSGSQMLKLYGEPEHTKDRGNGAKQYEYSQKGILFWTYQGKISQIVVFRPQRS